MPIASVANSQVKATVSRARLASRFQVAWATAAQSTSASVSGDTTESLPRRLQRRGFDTGGRLAAAAHRPITWPVWRPSVSVHRHAGTRPAPVRHAALTLSAVTLPPACRFVFTDGFESGAQARRRPSRTIVAGLEPMVQTDGRSAVAISAAGSNSTHML